MHAAITTTHAIPQNLPSGSILTEVTIVKCFHCLAVLGRAHDSRSRDKLQRGHRCAAKRLAKKPAAMIPYN
jgi:hypothetical protein